MTSDILLQPEDSAKVRDAMLRYYDPRHAPPPSHVDEVTLEQLVRETGISRSELMAAINLPRKDPRRLKAKCKRSPIGVVNQGGKQRTQRLILVSRAEVARWRNEYFCEYVA